MLRTDIINKYIEKYNYKSYLEIGVRDYYDNLDKIKCELKHGVDPEPLNKCDFVMTSDDFFSFIPPEQKYDIIFIDGLHISKQVNKDIENSLRHLNDNGTIVLHDCLPENEYNQFEFIVDGATGWTGDVWKSILKLRVSNPNVEVFVVDTDWGCGVVRKGNQELYKPHPSEEPYIYTWNWFEKNYRNVVNVISQNEFVQKIELN